MRAALTIILAALPLLAHAAAPSCLPSVLVPGVAPVGKMHPAKNPDRPALVTAAWATGFGLLWWCADGTVNEYHATMDYITSRWRTPRDFQLQYTANAASMRAAVGQSCIGTGTVTQSIECYPLARRPSLRQHANHRPNRAQPMHGSPQAGRERVAALTDQLAIVRWRLDQVRQQIRAMQRNLRNTETTAETRARVLREMAVHIPTRARSTVRT